METGLGELEDSFLKHAFKGWRDMCDVHEYKQLFASRGNNPCYGELDRNFAADDVFVDVRSGLGKLSVLAVALTKVGAAYGLELSKSRFRCAQEGADTLRKMGNLTNEERQRLCHWQGDCGSADGSLPEELLHSATAVLITLKRAPGKGGTCAVQGFLQQLISCSRARKLNNKRDCTIWSVAHALPQRAGLRLEDTVHVDGYVKGNPHDTQQQWRTKELCFYLALTLIHRVHQCEFFTAFLFRCMSMQVMCESPVAITEKQQK